MGEAPFVVKPEQRSAVNAYRESSSSGDSRLLIVGPTGVGKSYIAREILKERITHSINHPRKLHLLIAEQQVLSSQLANEMRGLQTEMDNAFEIVEWGGNNSASLARLMERVRHAQKTNGKPIVLVSTALSLRDQVDLPEFRSNGPVLARRMHERADAMSEHLSSYVFDEANFLGGPINRKILERLFVDENNSKSDMMLVGFAATPIRTDSVQVISEIFHGNVHYMGIRPEQLQEESSSTQAGKSPNRGIRLIGQQLRQSVQNGDLTPINLHRVQPNVFEASDMRARESSENIPFFVKPPSHNGVGRFETNQYYYDALYSQVRDIYEKHDRVVVMASTIDEANAYAEFLRKETRGEKNIEILTSDLGSHHRNSVMEATKIPIGEDGYVDIIVAVGQLDYGANIPNLGALHILSRQVGFARLIQRLGRILRLAPLKRSADIILPFEVNMHDLEAQTMLLEIARERSFPQNPNGGPNRPELNRAHTSGVAKIDRDLIDQLVIERKEILGYSSSRPIDQFALELKEKIKDSNLGESPISLSWLRENNLLNEFQYFANYNFENLVGNLSRTQDIEFLLHQSNQLAEQWIENIHTRMLMSLPPEENLTYIWLSRQRPQGLARAFDNLIRTQAFELWRSARNRQNAKLLEYVELRLSGKGTSTRHESSRTKSLAFVSAQNLVNKLGRVIQSRRSAQESNQLSENELHFSLSEFEEIGVLSLLRFNMETSENSGRSREERKVHREHFLSFVLEMNPDVHRAIADFGQRKKSYPEHASEIEEAYLAAGSEGDFLQWYYGSSFFQSRQDILKQILRHHGEGALDLFENAHIKAGMRRILEGSQKTIAQKWVESVHQLSLGEVDSSTLRSDHPELWNQLTNFLRRGNRSQSFDDLMEASIQVGNPQITHFLTTYRQRAERTRGSSAEDTVNDLIDFIERLPEQPTTWKEFRAISKSTPTPAGQSDIAVRVTKTRLRPEFWRSLNESAAPELIQVLESNFGPLGPNGFQKDIELIDRYSLAFFEYFQRAGGLDKISPLQTRSQERDNGPNPIEFTESNRSLSVRESLLRNHVQTLQNHPYFIERLRNLGLTEAEIANAINVALKSPRAKD